MSDTYPLAPLLTLGVTDIYSEQWPDYVSWLNLTEANVPDLLRIVLETPWEGRDWENEPDAWAPIHAWRAIAQLRSQAAIKPLIHLIDRSENNEWVWSEIPYVYAMLGPLSIPPLSKYIQESGMKATTAYTAINALSQIGQYYPETQPLLKVFFKDRITAARENHPAVNAYMVRALMGLEADDAVPAIREAYEEGLVDESISGDWADVLVEFGLADPLDGSPPRRTPQEQINTPRPSGTGGGYPTGIGIGGNKLSKKDKKKRKQAKRAQKQNRKKH